MIRTIDLKDTDLAILRAVLGIYLPSGTAAWVFGSRANGGARQYSDIDLALQGQEPLSLDILCGLRHALSESDLTIKVDLVDLQAVDPTFRRIIESQMLQLQISAHCG